MKNIKLLDPDFWSEVWETVCSQRWRSLMTAFGVFWGIFMLVILLGCGVGLNNGFVGNLIELPGNSIFMTPKVTTMPYQGFAVDREWKFTNSDMERIETRFSHIIQEAGGVNLIEGEQPVKVGNRSDVLTTVGISPIYYKAMPLQAIYGRFINDVDIDQIRKVCVIGDKVAVKLFGEEVDPCGNVIKVGDINYTIVGVVKKTNNSIVAIGQESEMVFLPLTTQQIAYNQVGEIGIAITILHSQYSASTYQPEIESFIKSLHYINPDDDQALRAFSLEDIIKQYSTMFKGINLLTWIIGLGTLIAGLIGISNIMMITVKERTQEIGVRRALGADPRVIIGQIMAESLTLTALAGFAGICFGLLVVVLIRKFIESGVNEDSFIGVPQIPFEVAIAAFVIMIVGGMFAGWMPAKRAMDIKAIDALRTE